MNSVSHCFSIIWAFALLGLASASQIYAQGNPPIELPPFRVEGKFSELRCGARFRYYIPGGKLKALVIRKMPKSWSAAGVKLGDSITKIENVDIDGVGLRALAKCLNSTFKADHPKCIFEVRSTDSNKIIRIEAVFEKDQSEFTIAYP